LTGTSSKPLYMINIAAPPSAIQNPDRTLKLSFTVSFGSC
jgi:hypothetical protein